MAATAIIILTTRRVASCHLDLAFQPARGISLIRRLAARLDGGMRDLEASFLIGVPRDPVREMQFSAEVNDTRFRVFGAHGASQLELLTEVVAAAPDCETVVVYPELACFPDVITALDMIAEHRRTGAHATIATRVPHGLLPTILDAGAIRRLAAVQLPAECSEDVLALLRMANRLFPDEPGFRFDIRQYDAQAKRGLRPATLPAHLLINDVHRRKAADRVTLGAAEKLCYTYAYLYGLRVVCLRFFTVYGPRQRPDLAIRKFTGLIDRGEPIPVYGDGSSARDYTYVTDIVEGVMASLTYETDYDVFNLGNSHPVALRTLIPMLEDRLGKRARIHWLPPQPGDVPITYADISKADRCLNYHPQVSLADGLDHFVSWYRSQKADLIESRKIR